MKKYEKAILWIILVQCTFFFALYRWHSTSQVDVGKALVPIKISSQILIGDEKELVGNSHALYTLVEFGDYECPPCAHMNSQVKLLLAHYPDDLRFRFRHYPLKMHTYAMSCAIAAEKARTLGSFSDVHDHLYALQTNVSPDQVTKLMLKLHLDITHLPIQQQVAAQKHVQEDIKIANSFGLERTPTFLLCCPDERVLKLNSLSQAEYFLK